MKCSPGGWLAVTKPATITDVLDEAAQRIRAEGGRLGYARRRVIETLRDHPGPYTAEDVAEFTNDVHVSSVYRSLRALEELGIVRHVHLAHGPAVYELSEGADDTRHLVCQHCGQVVTIPVSLFGELRERIAADYGFVLAADHFALLGTCAGCTEAATG